MKKVFKLSVTLLIITVLSVICMASVSAENAVLTSFEINDADSVSSGEIGAVSLYKAADGRYYAFLPSDADRTRLTVWFDESAEITCGGTKLENGKVTDVFASGDSLALTCDGDSYELRVIQAENEGTVYINTSSGNMDSVHADKSHKEPGVIIILDENGNVQYEGGLDYIKGRGNSTWNAEKKPYNIKLSKKADLFGMGKNKSWCLLANAVETSMIRNQLAYDYACNIGIDTTSPTRQLNLYLNGEYAGLYLITEKVEIGENRIDIYDLEGKTEDVNSKDLEDYPLAGSQSSAQAGTFKYAAIPENPDEITGGYLLELEKPHRYPDEASGFVTDNGQPVVVKTPEYASKAQVEYIRGYYQDFEDALYSANGYNSKGKHYSEYIDIDSLARMYLMLEFTANFDSCSSSFYLFKDVGGKLVAGPAWDYDGSLGHEAPNHLINHVENTGDPELLYAQTCFISNRAENRKSLLGQAFTHNDFQARVEKIWADEFSQYYPVFFNNITSFSEAIAKSFTMNAVRWNTLGTLDINKIEKRQKSAAKAISDYAATRFNYLNNAYSPDTYFVKYHIGNYGEALVHDTTIYKNGDYATVLDAPQVSSKNAEFVGWSENPDGSGTIYSPGDKIAMSDNITLYARWEETSFFDRFLRSVKEFFNSIAEFFRNLFGM